MGASAAFEVIIEPVIYGDWIVDQGTCLLWPSS